MIPQHTLSRLSAVVTMRILLKPGNSPDQTLFPFCENLEPRDKDFLQPNPPTHNTDFLFLLSPALKSSVPDSLVVHRWPGSHLFSWPTAASKLLTASSFPAPQAFAFNIKITCFEFCFCSCVCVCKQNWKLLCLRVLVLEVKAF